MIRFGVNYTPPSGWFHSWLDFSPSDAARDLEAIASLGVDHVRVFPLWPLLQPNRSLIRRSALDDLLRLVDCAAEQGLDVNVDLLQGHLSSFDFVPSWLESWHRRNLFTDPEVIDSVADYVRVASAALADRPNLLGVTLGNELNQFAAAPHPTPHEVDPQGAERWLRTMLGAAREGLGERSDVLVTHALYDASWYDDAQPFLPQHAATLGDATVTHSWVFNGAAQRAGSRGTGTLRHAEYLLRLAAAFGEEGRANWLQEVGMPTNVVDVADGPEFVAATMWHAAAVPDLFGITWWCSHDVSRALADFPALEYDLGLFDADGRLKPTGRRFAETVRELRMAPPADRDDIVLALPTPVVRAECAPGGAFYAEWMRRADVDGVGARIVLVADDDRGEMLAESREIVDVRGAAPLSHPTAPSSNPENLHA